MSNGLEAYSADQLESFNRPMQDAISAGRFTPSKLALEADAYIRSTSPETHPDQYTFLGSMGYVYTGPAAIYTSASEYTAWVNSELNDAFDAPADIEPTPPPPPPEPVVTNVITGSGLGDRSDAITSEDVNALYQKYLGRDAEQAGLDYWMQSIEGGASLEDVEYNISISPEAQQFQLDQTDLLVDTTAGDTTTDDVTDEPPVDTAGGRIYDYTNQRETGDASNLFWGNVSRQLTEDDLRAEFNADDNGQLRKAFGTFDNYLAYMDERQDLINSGQLKADWWDTGEALTDPESLGREGGMDDEALEQDIIAEGARQGEIGYNAQADLQNSLYQKYTGNSGTWYNQDGDRFDWNGSSFVKTAKVDDHNYGKVVNELILTGMKVGLANTVVGALNATTWFNDLLSTARGATQTAASAAGINPQTAQRVVDSVIAGVGTAGAVGDAANALDAINAAGQIISSAEFEQNPDPNLIMNLFDQGEAVGIENDDGTTTYNVYGKLPAGYIWDEIRNLVIHQETGTEYGVDISTYGIRVTLPNIEPKTEDGGGGGGGGDTASDADAGADAASGGADAGADSAAGAAGGDAASLPGAGADAGGTGSAEDPSGTTGVRTTSTGDGKPIIWTESNPWKNDPEGVFGGWILVNQDGEWGKSGTSRLQIEGTGVVIDIDWENGTYTSDYVFGSQDRTPVDDGLDTSQVDDAVTGGGDAAGAGGDGAQNGEDTGDKDKTGDFSGLLGNLLGGGDGAGGSSATAGGAGDSGAGAGGAGADGGGAGGDAGAGGAGGGGAATGGAGGAGTTAGGASAGTDTGGATGGDTAAGGDQAAGGTQGGAGTGGGAGDGTGTGDGAGTGTGSGTGTGAGTGAGTGDGTGDGSGDGFGDGLGLGFGLLAGGGASDASFSPFMTGLSYEPLRIGEAVFQQKDYNKELEQMIGELSQPMLTNIKGVA